MHTSLEIRIRTSLLALVCILGCAPSVSPPEDEVSGSTEGTGSAAASTGRGTTTGEAPHMTEGATSGASSGTSATGTTGTTGTPQPELCPGNPRSNCTVMPVCSPGLPCGHPDNVLDADGCPRPSCEKDGICPTGMRCYAPTICSGVCSPAGFRCEQASPSGECFCEGEAACSGGAYCLSEDEWPGCCVLDSENPEDCRPPGESD